MEFLLGIDLGTSGVKTVLMERGGVIHAVKQQGYETWIPYSGHSEQNPEDWWSATVRTVRDALAETGINPAEICAIGFSGQMHGTVMLDGAGNPVYPAVIWNDQRSTPQIDIIRERLAPIKISELTCNAVSPGFQAATMLWMNQNRPDVYGKIRYVILPKDYIRYRFTGEIGAETTDASSTLLFDTAGERWSDEVISALGLDRSFFPDPHTPAEIAGCVTVQAARETGLTAGTPVVFGGADQAMQALGSGTIAPGVVSSTIGSGGQLFAVTDKPLYDPQTRTNTFCNVRKGTWYLLGASLCAGLALNWFCRKVLGTEFSGADEEIRGIPPCSDGLIFLPYLTGDRTPHLDPRARGVFFGLTMSHERRNMLKAVMEGVTFSLRDSLGLFRELGVPVRRIIASGGGARSAEWLQMQADIYGEEIYTTESAEQAGVGAAIVAGLGTGLYSGVEQACAKVIRISETPVVPIPEKVEKYKEYYAVYRELYATNRELFRRVPV